MSPVLTKVQFDAPRHRGVPRLNVQLALTSTWLDMIPPDKDPWSYVTSVEGSTYEVPFELGSYVSRSERDATFEFPYSSARAKEVEHAIIAAFLHDRDHLEQYGHAALVIGGRRIGILRALVERYRAALAKGEGS